MTSASEVAILDSGLPGVGRSANPRALRETLAAHAITARLITDADLDGLEAEESIGVLVLPAAPSFPLESLSSLRRYLRRGGHLVCLGGYALSHLFAADVNGAWREQTATGGSIIPETAGPGWRPSDPRRCSVRDVERDGRTLRALRMEVTRGELDEAAGDTVEPFAEWSCTTGPFERGTTYVLRAAMRCEGVGGRHFAHFHWTYLRVEQADESGAVLHSALLDFEHPYLTGTEQWRELAYRFWTDPRASSLTVRIGIKPGAFGILWAADVEARREEWSTTATGMLCDGMHVLPEQIGMFDAAFRLDHACRVVTNGTQGIVSERVDRAGDLQGYAAGASTGDEGPLAQAHYGRPRTVRRLTPILDTVDEHGRPRGAALSLLHNTAGHYENSLWAFSGIENLDLAASVPGAATALSQVIRHMRRGVFLASVAPGFACYRDGEPVTVDVEIRNRGQEPCAVTLACEITDREGRRAWSGESAAALEARTGSARFTFSCGTPALGSDLYRVAVSARCGEEQVDRMEAGFAAWKPGLQAAGHEISFAGNYFRIDGRPTLMCGTKGGVFWLDDHLSEDPLCWDAECAALQDSGLHVYGMVGLSQWITIHQPPAERERMMRRLDARVQICHAHGIVPFIDLQFHPVAGVDRDAEIAYARALAERYRGLRSLFFYVTGDINIPLGDDPSMRSDFQRFLREKYGTDKALAAAWREAGARIDNARIEPMKAYWHRRPWTDVRAANLHEFRNAHLRAWLGMQAAALREVSAGAGSRLITAEFWSDQQLDQWNASTGLDFSAMGIGLGQRRYMHRYDAPMLCLADMRMAGQSFTIGEFGTQVHPAFDHTGYSWSDAQGKLDRFSMVVHHAFGLGGSMIATWDSADLDYYIFPWGLLHSDRRVPKAILSAYRNFSLFFRRLAPRWVPPDVLLVLPDENRRSGNFHVVTEALFNAARLLIQCRVDFAVINDGGLASVSAAPRALFYPLPFCPSDAAVAEVKRLAEAGSHVYISGDISFDPQRRRTRASRLTELAGVRFLRELRPNISRSGPAVRIRAEKHTGTSGGRAEYGGHPCIAVEPVDASVTWRSSGGEPVAFHRAMGHGSVSFTTDPLELYAVPDDVTGARERREVYAAVLAGAGVEAHQVTADDDVESFQLPLEDGGDAFTFYCNRPDGGAAAKVSLRARGVDMQFEIGPCRGGAVVFDGTSRLVAWEGRGTLVVGGQPILSASDDIMVYSADGLPLAHSESLVVLPFGPGSLTLHGAVATRGVSRAVAGEITAGDWRALGAPAVELTGDGAVIRWSAADSRDIVLVGSDGGVTSAAASVVTDLRR